MSLVKQLVISFLLLALLPLLIISYQSMHCSHQAVMDLQRSAMNQQLDTKELQIRNWLKERKKDLKSLINVFSVKDKNIDYVEFISSKEQTFENIYVYDSQWNLVNKEKEITHIQSNLLNADQKDALSRSDELLYISAHSHENGSFSIHVSCRLTDGEDVKGYVIAVIDATKAITSIIRNYDSMYKLRLINDENKDILKPSAKNHHINLPEKIRSGSNQLVKYRNQNNEKVVSVSRKIPELGSLIVIETPESSSLKWIKELRNRSLLTAIVTLIISGILVYFLSRSITEPFKHLRDSAIAISKGNIEARMSEEGVTESKELARSFNTMLDSLNQLHTQLSNNKALAAIGQLTSSVVHEMRNPLSSIRLNIQAFEKKFADDPFFSELGTISCDQVDRLEKLLSELLLYGKPMTLKKNKILLTDLMNMIKTDSNGLIEKQKLLFECENLKADVKLEIDIEKIRQVFINLIKNSSEATSGKGTVTISAESGDAWLKITVKDDGPGIPSHLMEQLFLPFVTGKAEGTGLGLANVQRYIELNGGNIKAFNIENSGAKFIITLPIYNEDNA